MKFIIDANFSDEQLNRIVSASEAQIIDHRKSVAQFEQIRDMAKLRLLAIEIAGAEVE
ncbi:hypothetical protein [Paraburkholderia sp. UCT31]|uniref:hypothetical protein n=1 Tax=Paraburkholderia sp. UCT31 TaxID=2615209 RepID=UPI001656060C|nr:hypothetical protein [Paraburkholderia sp. UCT31]